uniref:HNH endonuclease n=2 Tax=Bradyrhizobium quebecense TaxID=2748629 RepID=A0A973WQ56_9BRAD
MVNKTATCWEWTGHCKRNGYGEFDRGYAHRASWKLNTGQDPAAQVLHKCDNRKCVRIDHLFLGSIADNMRDKQLKGRAANKLTPEEVSEIRSSQGTQEDIGLRYDVDRTTIGRIIRRQTWSHVS